MLLLHTDATTLSVEFLRAMGEVYEIVIFTASLSKYADPVLDQLDIHKVVKSGARLFRESCYNNKGNYVKVRSRPFSHIPVPNCLRSKLTLSPVPSA